MVEALKKNSKITRKGPVVLVIMDGVGFGKYSDGDAVAAAMTKNLDGLYKNYPWTKLMDLQSVFPQMPTWVTVR